MPDPVFYKITTDTHRYAYLETIDEVVTRASRAFKWAIGHDVVPTLAWAIKHGMEWRTMDHEVPSLSDLPTDSEIAKKVTP